jgi:mannose-6-phosphate isomerase-like protein (cupin superfamily)
LIVRKHDVTPIDFDGLAIHDYTANQDISASLAVIHVPPGAHHAEAWSRRSDKYYYILAGRLNFVLAGQPCELEAGDFCLVRQGIRFSYENRTGESTSLLLVHAPSFDLDAEVFVQDERQEGG